MSINFEDISILLVEDNNNDRVLLAEILSKYFKNIIEASNGKEAYAEFKRNRNIDIIISDIEMPELDGIELLRLVRLSDLYIPFIIITAETNSNILLKAIDLNVNSFLLKPIDLKKLLEKVDIFCEKKLYEKKLKFKENEVKNYIKAVDKVALIYRMKENGAITYMNEGMLTVSKYTEDEIEELNFKDFIHPDIPQKYIDNTWEKIKANKLWKGNTKFITKDKETFYLNNTVFKVKNSDESEEYITIAFLTTQENLEKRDFHKKVLLNIKEANIKEYKLKDKIEGLESEINNLKTFISSLNNNDIELLNKKIIDKEKQIVSYEKEIVELNDKYKKMLSSKKSEVEHHVNSLQSYRMKIDLLKTQIKDKTEEINVTHNKIKSFQEDIIQKDKIIKDLRFIINQMEEDYNKNESRE